MRRGFKADIGAVTDILHRHMTISSSTRGLHPIKRLHPEFFDALDAIAGLLTLHAEERRDAEKEVEDTIADARASVRDYEYGRR